MTLDGIITLAALIVAIYSVLPRSRRIDVSLRYAGGDLLIIILSVIAIFYLFYEKTIQKIFGINVCLTSIFAKYDLDSGKASFLIIIFVTFFLIISFFRAKFYPSKIKILRDLIEELIYQKQYPELIKLVSGHLDNLDMLYNRRFFLYKIRSRVADNSNNGIEKVVKSISKEELDNLYNDITNNTKRKWTKKQKLQIIIGSITGKLRKNIAKLFPKYEKEHNVASEVVRKVIRSPLVISGIIENHPYFAINILKYDFYENDAFLEDYLKALLERKHSILYTELINNQNTTSKGGYCINPENRLLCYFFEDSKIAEELAVYRPIGEYILSYLIELKENSSKDLYNNPPNDFTDEGKWNSPIFVAIRFFDIMVSSALFQNIQWHMWLFYFDHFIDKILNNLHPNEALVDSADEYPTKYHYLIYEIFSTQRSWIDAIKYIPITQENVILENSDIHNENGNIPKSAILSMGTCLKAISLCKNITPKFRNYIFDIVFRLYFELMYFERNNPSSYKYSEVLANSIKFGGMVYTVKSPEYKKILKEAFDSQRMEFIIKHDSKDVERLKKLIL